MADKYLEKYLELKDDEIDKAINEKEVMNLREKIKGIYNKKDKEKRDKEISYKILKTKASSHLGAHVIGPVMEWYYKKFRDYTPKK
ncbi:MAG TPA: hypothetical protein VJ912_00285 [Candidatus Nanoarchaeia archaeon]|nr:hypothetical protein [Candidatus Nanoarchaeia archaeon]